MESSSAGTVLTEEGYQPVFFDPRPLKNLLPIDEMVEAAIQATVVEDFRFPPVPPSVELSTATAENREP